jgi:hypothetical protein
VNHRHVQPGRVRRRARHRRRSRLLRLIGGLAIVVGVATGVLVPRSVAPHPRIRTAGIALAPVLAPPPAAPAGSTVSRARTLRHPQTTPVPFARARGVALDVPVPDPVAIAYHEASFHDALPLHPLGHVIRDANRWKFRPPARTPGPGYIVMSSRGRPTPATSAADVVVRPYTPIRSPVNGVIVAVKRYRLYCRYADDEVAIRPDGRPRLRVTIIHLRGLRVHPGARVSATLSVIGFARIFPFRSQVDDYVRGGNPHVHIEITKPHPARRPAC